MPFYSNNYFCHDFSYSSRGFSPNDRANSLSSSNLTTLASANRPAYSNYMSTYYTSPANSTNAATIIVTKKIPDTSSFRSSSLAPSRIETSLTVNVNTDDSSSAAGKFQSGLANSRNQASYDEFLRSAPVVDKTASRGSADASGQSSGHANRNTNNNEHRPASADHEYEYASTSEASAKKDGREKLNDVTATASSTIQLSLTDDLMTQVDYCLNEVDNRMTCSGKQVEIESFELTTKGGLISKCLYINQLLGEAKLSETSLDSDPMFTQSGKCVLLFASPREAEEFANYHSSKFSVQFSDSKPKKAVSFNETSNSAHSNTANDNVPNPKGQSKISDDVSVSANANKPRKVEGYEILTIRAKLKQRINQNRTNQVTLGDIDSIMRNVVTIIQDEFMKRFPSGPSPAAIAAEAASN